MQVPRWSARAGGARAAVLALALGSALLLPGVIVERARSSAPASAWAAQSDDAHSVAVFELECETGLFEARCLHALEQITRELEADPRVIDPVRSLARAAWVSAEHGVLRSTPRVEPLLPAARDAEALRVVHARLHADPALAARLVRADERAAYVVAELVSDLSASSARAFVEYVRARFDRPPHASASVRLALAPKARHWAATLAGPVLGSLCLALGLALVGARLAAAAALAGVAALLWYGGALAAHGAPRGSFEAGAFAALGAGACASLPLLQRARAELRRGAERTFAASSGVAFAAAPLAIAFAAFAVAGALTLAHLSALLAALAAALLAAAALVPAVRSGSELRAIDRALERILLRLDVVARSQPRALASVSLALAVAALAGMVNRPVESGVAPVPRMQRWVVDSGAASGALEPAFLERVDALRHELATRPGVRAASSLVDALLAPVTRGGHDGDPSSSRVPPSRAEVEAALALFSAAQLGGTVDRERRRVTIDAWIDDVPTVAAGSATRLLVALALLFALTAAWLRSPGAGVVAALPASLAAALLFGARAPLGASALGAAAAGFSALLLLARAQTLARAGAERGIALSLALRDAGRPSAALALLGCGLASLAAAPWAVLAAPLGVAVGLALAPVLARSFATRVFARREPLRAEVSPAVGSFQRRGTDARR